MLHSFKIIAVFLLILGLSACGEGYISEEDLYSEPQLYKRAKNAMNRGEFDQAIRGLELLEARYPFGDYAIQGQLDLMYAYFRSSSPEDAIATAKRFRRLNPTDNNLDYTYYIEGLSEFDKNRSLFQSWFPKDPARYDQQILKNAYNAFYALVIKYPKSRYAADGEQRMVYLRNEMAENCMNAAQYNEKRGAFLGAINRAYYCIDQFNGAPAVETAPDLIARNAEKVKKPQKQDVKWFDRSRW